MNLRKGTTMSDKAIHLTKSDPAGSDGSVGSHSLRDTNRGNPNGDVTDNSAGANPSRDTSKVFHTGSNLSGMAKAPSLSGLQRY